VRSRSGKYSGDSWLLFKEADEYARLGADAAIPDDMPNSVGDRAQPGGNRREQRSRLAFQQVGRGERQGGRRREGEAVDGCRQGRGRAQGSASRARRSGARDAGEGCPRGAAWIHEIKYDGYRMLCKVADGSARMISRNRKDWTANFPTIASAAARLPLKSAWLDGEVVALDDKGRSSFQALQNALSASPAVDLAYLVFDLLYLDGYDLRGVKLTERKALLQRLVASAPANIRYSDHFSVPGRAFKDNVCKLGLEGMVSKRGDLAHHNGRSAAWLKVKCERRQEMVIGGFTDPSGSRRGFGALLLGVYDGGKLLYSGRVGTGFDDATLAELRQTLDKLEQPKSAFENPPRGADARGVHWVRPKLVAEVTFTEWTTDGTLRHPSFVGLRADKKPTDVVREKERVLEEAPPEPQAQPAADARKSKPRDVKSKEKPEPIPARATTSRAVQAKQAKAAKAASLHAKAAKAAVVKRSAPGDGADAIAGIVLSNPDKILYPEAGFTKRDLARYYERVGEWILPHLAQRPLTLLRCPNGWDKPCFYQKNADKSVIEAIDRVKVPGGSLYMMANTVTAIVGLLQMGALELHPWGSSAPHLRSPDRLTFDLDPDDKVSWDDLKKAAFLVKTLLESVGMEPFLKTTAAKGCTWSSRSSRRSIGRTRKGSRRPRRSSSSGPFPIASRRSCSRSRAAARSSSTICATPRARPPSARIRYARARTRRCRPRSSGASSSATSASITST
jgi:bifunctional non-homologous end joining protein LigD